MCIDILSLRLFSIIGYDKALTWSSVLHSRSYLPVLYAVVCLLILIS